MNIQIYEKNLSAIRLIDPYLAAKLSSVNENSRFEVFIGKNDPLDVNLYDTKEQKALYDKPIEDTVKKLDELSEFNRFPLMFFFGLGNGVILKALLQNEALTTLIVIEPQMEIIFIALHMMDFSNEILTRRLYILPSEDFDFYCIRSLISRGGFGVYLKLYRLHPMLKWYEDTYHEEMRRVNKIVSEAILHFIKSHGNDSIDALVGIEHFIQNLPRMVENPSLAQLKTKRNAEVAVLVSTGPSLSKQLPLLKQIQQHVTIISVDASMPILELNDIKPDIVCSMERIELTAKFFERTSKEFQDEIVFALSALQHDKIFENVKAGTKCVMMRPFGYMQHFGFHDYGYVGIGLSAANMAFEVAYQLGFRLLVLIGQDLAYAQDGRSHAANHTFSETEVKYKETDSFVTAYGGEGKIRTTDIWRLFMGFFVSNIQEVRDEMITVNATEGGARIDGAVEMPFAEVVENFVDKNHIKARIKLDMPDKETIESNIEKAKEHIEKILEYAAEKKRAIEELFLDVAEECKKLEELNDRGHLDSIDFKHIDELRARIDEIKELLSDKKFHSLFWDTVQSFIINQELEIAVIVTKAASTQLEMRAKVIEYLFAHKNWLFMLAGGIDAQITVFERAKRRWWR